MFNAIRKGLGLGALTMASRIGSGAGNATKLAFLGLNRASRMSNAGLSASMGGVAGGMYGAFSDDTSVLGGALMGAGLGAGGVGAASLARTGRSAYNVGRGAFGMSRSQAAGAAARNIGNASSRFIGSQHSRASNAFRGRFGG